MSHIARHRDAQYRFTALALLAAAAFLTTSCSILPEREAVDVYQLPATTAATTGSTETLATSLRIARPSSELPLAGRQIVVIPQDNRVSVYQGARWSDAVPVLLRNRLLDAFRASGRIGALSSDETNVQADYELKSELRAFQSEYRNGVPEIVIRLDALLVQPTSDRIVASRRFEVRQAATAAKISEVVRTFGLATDRLEAQLVPWAIEQMTATPRNEKQ